MNRGEKAEMEVLDFQSFLGVAGLLVAASFMALWFAGTAVAQRRLGRGDGAVSWAGCVSASELPRPIVI